MADPLDSQAAAFAHLLELSGDPDAAFRSAVALAEGLFPHQIEGVAFLLGRRRAILADDMGLGKTRQAIVSLRHLAPGGPRLVVCPASVKRNWAREIEVVAPGSSILVIEGSAPVSPTAEWVILNYDIIGRHMDSLQRVPWAALVFDEAHYLKNHTSARSKLARQLTISASAKATARQLPPSYARRAAADRNAADQPAARSLRAPAAGRSPARTQLSGVRQALLCGRERGIRMEDRRRLQHRRADRPAARGHAAALEGRRAVAAAQAADVAAGRSPRRAPASRAVKKVFEILAGKHDRPATTRALDLRRRGKLLAFLVEARQALAFAKVSATLDFVRGAIDQGEKVIVFSCFDDPIQKLARELGAAAVVLTGKTPSGMRQQLVDRFQHDDEVRVFVANIIAGGTGVNLTAATQVVFNDLDWVPTNHWQAEDRAYRIGQTRTVNVTYFVARNTIDDFVEAVLETKAALVNAIVEGEALAAGYGGDVLDELQHVLHSISAGATAPGSIEDDEVITRLLRQASQEFRETHQTAAGRPVAAARSERERQALARALEGLVKVLSGPSARRFRIASTSHQGLEYRGRGDRRGRHLHLSGLRIPWTMPPRTGRQGRTGGGRPGPGAVCGSAMKIFPHSFLAVAALLTLGQPARESDRLIAIFVVDGLRPDSINPVDTPTIDRLRAEGVDYVNSHSVFPTSTRVNTATLVTGTYPARHGIVGNSMFVSGVNPQAPFDTGDFRQLMRLAEVDGRVVTVPTLGEILQRSGRRLVTVSSGTTGNGFLLNPEARRGAGIAIHGLFDPGKTAAYPPEVSDAVIRRFGSPPPDPDDAGQMEWTDTVLRDYVLPELRPDVVIDWMGPLDAAQHDHGVSSPEAKAALRVIDKSLSRTIAAMQALAPPRRIDVVVTSDHGFAQHTAGVNVVESLIAAGVKASTSSTDVVVASQSQSVLFYVPSHEARLVSRLVGVPAAATVGRRRLHPWRAAGSGERAGHLLARPHAIGRTRHGRRTSWHRSRGHPVETRTASVVRRRFTAAGAGR